jgi:hypothetical protein
MFKLQKLLQRRGLCEDEAVVGYTKTYAGFWLQALKKETGPSVMTANNVTNIWTDVQYYQHVNLLHSGCQANRIFRI